MEEWEDTSFQEAKRTLRVFANERNWGQFHTPRNLLLALTGEVGELAQLFQWRQDCTPGLPQFTLAEKARVGEEISDVLSNLIRLSDVCGIDIARAFRLKMDVNRSKYPKESAFGSC